MSSAGVQGRVRQRVEKNKQCRRERPVRWDVRQRAMCGGQSSGWAGSHGGACGGRHTPGVLSALAHRLQVRRMPVVDCTKEHGRQQLRSGGAAGRSAGSTGPVQHLHSCAVPSRPHMLAHLSAPSVGAEPRPAGLPPLTAALYHLAAPQPLLWIHAALLVSCATATLNCVP